MLERVRQSGVMLVGLSNEQNMICLDSSPAPPHARHDYEPGCLICHLVPENMREDVSSHGPLSAEGKGRRT